MLTFYTTSGKEGWLKAGVVGRYTMLIITDLRIHLPPSPTGTPPSQRRRMENTIDYQIIIFLINFTTKFEEEPKNFFVAELIISIFGKKDSC